MSASKTRRAVVALTLLTAPILTLASPARADTYYPRLSTGGCIIGIADTYNGEPVCRVIGGRSRPIIIGDVGGDTW